MRALFIFMFLATTASAESPKVVTDIAPVHSLVAQVMEGVDTPDLLLEAGGDPHHMALRPSQARALAQADLVIWVGPALTPWLGEALAGSASVSLPLAPDLVEDVDDPHLWLNPDFAEAWLTVIAEALSQIDPDNLATYRTNAELAQQAVQALTQKTATQLDASGGARLLAAHDAWGHFADRFGLQIVGAIKSHDDAAPGAGHLGETRDMISIGAVDCVLSEGVETDALVATVVGDSGTPVATVHPLGAGIDTGVEFYSGLLSGVAQAIAACVEAG